MIEMGIYHCMIHLYTSDGKLVTYVCCAKQKKDNKHDFSAQMNPPFHDKTLDIKNNPFFSKFTQVSTKIPPFSSKNITLFMNFRTNMRVVK